MDTFELKPKHKFFDRVLDLDLQEIVDFSMKLREDILINNKFNIPQEEMSGNRDPKVNPKVEVTNFAHHYNIFLLGDKNMDKLLDALRETAIEAFEYYGVDYKNLDYCIRGWVNVTFSPVDNPNDKMPTDFESAKNLHEHMGGNGAPDFHGYYCVNAEPSVTNYAIDKIVKFENVNKNNRLVVSETGHPHGIGLWVSKEPRITIAYDIAPREHMGNVVPLVSLW